MAMDFLQVAAHQIFGGFAVPPAYRFDHGKMIPDAFIRRLDEPFRMKSPGNCK
jgi:hypothetical protein